MISMLAANLESLEPVFKAVGYIIGIAIIGAVVCGIAILIHFIIDCFRGKA